MNNAELLSKDTCEKKKMRDKKETWDFNLSKISYQMSQMHANN